MIKNRIYKTELIEWQSVKDLQPDNLKLPYNYEHIKNSIKRYGIAKAYDVCEINGDVYWIDGHTRTQILNELVSQGVKIPNKLTANFCEVKNKEDAIKILLEVHNQKQNPIAQEVLVEWIDVEEFEINVQALNVTYQELEIDNSNMDLGGDDDYEVEEKAKGILLPLILNVTNQVKQKYKLVAKQMNGENDNYILNEILNKYIEQ